ncbi:MAG: hypothetical protein EAZ67_06610 [Cytophagales bacterium]|nr:MAG: hypothetical protein EAZ67_06610 [Cytophagales bacterium]
MKIILSIFLFFLTTALQAQLPLSTSNKKAAALYNEAQNLMRARAPRGYFEQAVENYKRCVKLDPDFFEAHLSLATSYNMMRDPANLEFHLRRCAELKGSDPKYAFFNYEVGEFELAKGKYEAAKACYEKYLSMNPSDKKVVKLANLRLKSCDFAMEGMKKPLEIKPQLLPETVNAFPLQYYPNVSADEQMLFFTMMADPRGHEDLVLSRKLNGQWQKPEIINELVTLGNEGTCAISADGKCLIFTVCSNMDGRLTIGSCDLFISYFRGGCWTNPVNMGINVNSREWDSQPTLSADGRTLYFVSARGGGYGKSDIWMSKKNENDEWLAATNLGAVINTSEDDVSPFIHSNGQSLFFSSDGHVGYGNQDIFRSDKQPDGTFGEPQNLGYPINNNERQEGLCISSDGKKAYYSADNTASSEKLASSKLYYFEIPEQLQIKASSSYVRGRVFDAKTKALLGARIELANLNTKQTESIVNSDDKSGDYLFVLNKGSEYALNVSKKGYLFQSLTFDYTKPEDNKSLDIDIYLEPAEKGSSVVLKNIFFESAKWDLLEKSAAELATLVKFLNNNPSMKIEISGHTDDVGANEANKILSEKRAQTVVDYLVKAGVDKTRIVAKGYGETAPKVENSSDANRALNRRIEFKIL